MAQLEKELVVDESGSGGPVSASGEITEIDVKAERRVLSKFDWLVMPQMSILVLFAYLDRTNIGTLVFGSSSLSIIDPALTLHVSALRKCTGVWLREKYRHDGY